MRIEYDSSKESVELVDTYVPPPVITPQPIPDPWPRLAPDLLDINLTDQASLTSAKWLDSTLQGWDNTASPGSKNWGLAIHYGDMAGPLPIVNGVADYSGKLSNPSYPPRWGVESNGLHYLENGTDGAADQLSSACRMILWNVHRFSVPEVYYRYMVYAYPETLTNTTELGIKLTGAGGTLANGGPFAEIFEIGKKTATGFPLQAYRYDAEGYQGVTLFPRAPEFTCGRWYTHEGHLRVESAPGAGDGLMEFKVDGQMVYVRSDVRFGATAISTFSVQLYHGGVRAPSGLLRFKTARIALSRLGWIGPAPEVQ